jgi:membrane protein implicated in regulation of membrane protease activity
VKCNRKTILTIAFALALVLALGYWTLPQLRGYLTTFILVACSLVCPLSMLFMMRGMHSSTDKQNVRSDAATERKS